MYIHALDGPWHRHPFWLPRFLLTRPEDLDALRASGIGLTIDESKGAALAMPVPANKGIPQATPAENIARRLDAHAAPGIAFVGEREKTAKLVARSAKVMRQVFDSARLGRAVRSEDVVGLVDEISDSVTRNRHMFIGISRLKSKDSYTYLHSVAVCALMINLARQLGLDEMRVRELGMAGLLHDIGKMSVPTAILNKPAALDDDENRVVRSHPEKGHALLSGDPLIPPVALDVCLHHHEKVDGTGHPFRLSADQISLPARMGAICDVYDALTSNRAYKRAWTPVEAVTAMVEWEGQFDRELLFKFMASIGVFPVGMLVRLRTNRLAVTLDNGRRASRPKARAFYSTKDRAMCAIEDMVITDSLSDDQIVAEEQPEHWALDDWFLLRERILHAQPGETVSPARTPGSSKAA